MKRYELMAIQKFDRLVCIAETDEMVLQQFTNPNKTTFKDLNKFWDIPTDIVLRGAHGSIFADVNKVVSVILIYGIPEADAINIAQYLKIVFNTDKFYV